MKNPYANPCIISPGSSVKALKRLPRLHAKFDENYLQELLANNPGILPANTIRDDIGDYRRQKKMNVPREEWQAHRSSTRFASLEASTARDWMLAVLLREALLVTEEGIAATPGDVDLAMVMGTGFAPFRGGPLCVGDQMGWEQIERTLDTFGQEDNRFLPDPVLRHTVLRPRAQHTLERRSGAYCIDAYWAGRSWIHR